MNKRIIIDAAYKEETRVAIIDEEGLLQDFERESISIKKIKGNIYLAKITRIEPSLQAAFVDYGEDKHGFLPFADIHPDYYVLPEEDKQKLIKDSRDNTRESDYESEDADLDNVDDGDVSHSYRDDDTSDEMEKVETVGSIAVEEEVEFRPHSLHRKYKIQDVIKTGQNVLVQVLKEERGNKCAAVTTYISLAGKFCVLMTNSVDKGGVSKKIENIRDRKLLRNILRELNIPRESSVIIRTAGVGKKPEEIKRDYNYLINLWNNIREVAIKSKAPTFIHSEDDAIRKCIRDSYNSSVKEIVVEGEVAYNLVCDLVKIATSPEEKTANVKFYTERTPIFHKYGVEQQVSALYNRWMPLPSGGSIVIDPTEALVSIDVNSGKATKESDVEETAVVANIEAAQEIARQLRLRDLAGLIVIDFIDMYDARNRRAIERALRDALQDDRARIQIARISMFGLMEMSRQRLGASFFESSSDPCPCCKGSGVVKATEMTATSILRAIRHSTVDKQVKAVHISTSDQVLSYLLNYKRQDISNLENNYKINVFLHYTDDPGKEGFLIKKRNKLSDEEKRELNIEIKVGEVNKRGLEGDLWGKGFGSEDDEDKTSENIKSGKCVDRKDKKYKHPHYKRYKGTKPKNKSILGKIIGKLKNN